MRVMLGLAGRRMLQLIPVLFGASFITFAILNMLPGSAALAATGLYASAAQIAAAAKQLGLNHPYFDRYLLWIWHALHGQLGISYIAKEQVTTLIAQRFPVSFELVVLAILCALAISIPVAILSARKPLGIFDWVARVFAMLSLSIPGFVMCVLLLLLFAVKLNWLPASGFVPLSQGILPNLKTMALPVMVQVSILFGSYTRILRGDMVDQLKYEDYVTTARSKAISERRLLISHVFKNSVFSLITIVGTQFGTLIAGGAIAETIFGLPGIGALLLQSITNKDIPVVQGLVVIVAILVVFMNLITDLLYMSLDPRVKYGSTAG